MCSVDCQYNRCRDRARTTIGQYLQCNERAHSNMYANCRFVEHLKYWFPLLMSLAWLLPLAGIISGYLRHTEMKLISALRVAGLMRFVYWASWIVLATSIMAFSAIIVLLLLKVRAMLHHRHVDAHACTLAVGQRSHLQ